MKRFIYAIIAFIPAYAFADDNSSITGYVISAIKACLSSLFEELRKWVVTMFQELLDSVLQLVISILPKEIQNTTFTLPADVQNALALFAAIFPVSYAATLLFAYTNFKMAFWIYRKCMGFFGLVKPKFTT